MGERETMDGLLKEYKAIADLFTERLRESFGERVLSVVLYGSCARGNVKPTSDIDLLIICRQFPKDYGERVELISPIARTVYQSNQYRRLKRRPLYPELQYIVLTEEEAEKTAPLDFDLTRDSLVLFDNGFFSKKMDNLRRRMAELGSKRVDLRDGTWYWDLKPDLRVGEEFKI